MENKKIISILIIFLFISLCGGDNSTLTFYEENLTPRQLITYSDNTAVIRLVERLNVTCNVPNLTYRILYPNGTLNLITVYDSEHQIPSYNFCFDGILFRETITNYIFVLYGKDIVGTDLTATFGMMIDWSGKITR